MQNIIFSILFLFLFSSCDDDCVISGGYQFEIPVTLSPAKTVYAIGDTITISTRFSDQVYDRATDQTYSLKAFNFHPISGFCRLDTVGIDTLELVNLTHFDFLIDTVYNYQYRFFNSDGAALVGRFRYTNNEYDLEYKLVTKKSGLYLTALSTLFWKFGQDQDFPGKCPRLAMDTRMKLNEGKGNNAELLLEAFDPGWTQLYNNRLEKDFHGLGSYCFKVE